MLQLMPGGFLKAVSEDTTPVLGGDLDGGGHDISNVGVGTFGGLVVDGNTVNLSDTTDEYVLAFDTATNTWRGVAAGNGAGLWSRADTTLSPAAAGDNVATTGAGTFGSLVVDTDTLVVDAANNRVGLGTAEPGVKFDVRGPDFSLGKFTRVHVSDVGVSFGLASSFGRYIAFGLLGSGVTGFLVTDGTAYFLRTDPDNLMVRANMKLGWADVSSGGPGWNLDCYLARSGAGKIYSSVDFIARANLGVGSWVYGTNADKVLAFGNGTAPTTGIANGMQMYAADYAAGHSCLHIRNEDGDVIRLEQQAHIDDPTDLDTSIAAIGAILDAMEAQGLLAAA